MPTETRPRPFIRRLWTVDRPLLRAHFLRLDPEGRRLRFTGTVGDSVVAAYADHLVRFDTVIFGAFLDGELRAVGELTGRGGGWPPEAEFALSVERDWRDRGIGDALFSHLLTAARNRGLRVLHMTCLGENAGMRRLAARHGIQLSRADDALDGTLVPGRPTPLSFAVEAMTDTLGAVQAAGAWIAGRARA